MSDASIHKNSYKKAVLFFAFGYSWFMIANLDGFLTVVFIGYPRGSSVSDAYIVVQAVLVFFGAFIAVFSQVWYLGVASDRFGGRLEESRILYVAGAVFVVCVVLIVLFRQSLPPEVPRIVVSFYVYVLPLAGLVYILFSLVVVASQDSESGAKETVKNALSVFLFLTFGVVAYSFLVAVTGQSSALVSLIVSFLSNIVLGL